MTLKAVRKRLWWIFCCFSTRGFLVHVTAFGLRPSGLGFDGFFFCFRLEAYFSRLLLLVSGLWVQALMDVFLFDLRLLFSR